MIAMALQLLLPLLLATLACATPEEDFASTAPDKAARTVTTVVNWWEMALLAAGPCVAFGYALSAAVFLAAWGECGWTDHVASLMPRNSLMVMAVAFAVHRSSSTSNREETPEHQQGMRLLVAVAISVLASAYLCYETARVQVQGGPPPSLAVSIKDANLKKTDPQSVDNTMVVVITGCNAGIGKETARQLYERGRCTVVMACRDLDKAAAARDEILQATSATSTTTNAGSLEIQLLDLGSLGSVRQAVKAILKKHKRIDVLINNAGIMMDQRRTSKDGHELVMQANYLGHYLLTRLLLSSLLKSDDPRIVHVTSSTYTMACANNGVGIDLDDLFCETTRPYTLFGQYSQSKLAQILSVRELAARYPTVTVAAVHPGLVRTNVTRNLPAWMQLGNRVFGWALQQLQKTPAQGAWCTVHCATAVDLPTGGYWVNRRLETLRPAAKSEKDAAALWNLSAKLVGLEK